MMSNYVKFLKKIGDAQQLSEIDANLYEAKAYDYII